jgi:MFS family permease
MGIGGEYTAINSTIQELVPAGVRGWVDLVINGSFWVGAALGAVGAIILLDLDCHPPDLGWRLAFFIGAALGLIILVLQAMDPGKPALADQPWPPGGAARSSPTSRRAPA